MKTAKELLLEFLEAFPIAAKAAALFADDGTLEIPYLESVNIQSMAEGPGEIEKFLATMIEMVPGWKFSNIKILMEDENQVFAEYELLAMATHTNRIYHQLFFGRLQSNGLGKIKLLREAQNPLSAAKALLRNSIDDIPKE